MRTRSRSDDDQLLAQLLAPPALDDGIQSLTYWRERRRRLPRYRIAARREAARMMLRWEHRLAAGLLAQREVNPSASVSAALLLARARVARWGHRARIVVLTTVSIAVAIVAVPMILALLLVLHAL